MRIVNITLDLAGLAGCIALAVSVYRADCVVTVATSVLDGGLASLLTGT